MRTIAILNQKGGCGKTTTAINLSAVMARMGRRVLLIDMDPQSHCALGLGVPENRIELDVTDALLNAGSPKPIDASRLLWRPVRNLDLIPSRMRLAGLEAAKGGLAEAPDREQRLKKALDPMRRQYDVAVIDCSPSIGLLTYNALVAADMVVIPVETGYFSLQGATRQAATVRTLAKRLGVTPGIWMLATMHDAGNAVATDLLDELHRRFKGRVVPLVVRRDAKLREAASFGQSIADYAPGCEGAFQNQIQINPDFKAPWSRRRGAKGGEGAGASQRPGTSAAAAAAWRRRPGCWCEHWGVGAIYRRC
jgi:chromosome partitioning protein